MKLLTAKMDTYFASLLFCILAPLFPLLVSLLFSKTQYSEVLLTAALYPVSLFIQSTSKSLFSVGIGLLMFYTICLSNQEHKTVVFFSAIIAIVLVAGTHAVERYHLHVVKEEKFFNF